MPPGDQRPLPVSSIGLGCSNPLNSVWCLLMLKDKFICRERVEASLIVSKEGVYTSDWIDRDSVNFMCRHWSLGQNHDLKDHVGRRSLVYGIFPETILSVSVAAQILNVSCSCLSMTPWPCLLQPRRQLARKLLIGPQSRLPDTVERTDTAPPDYLNRLKCDGQDLLVCQ